MELSDLKINPMHPERGGGTTAASPASRRKSSVVQKEEGTAPIMVVEDNQSSIENLEWWERWSGISDLLPDIRKQLLLAQEKGTHTGCEWATMALVQGVDQWAARTTQEVNNYALISALLLSITLGLLFSSDFTQQYSDNDDDNDDDGSNWANTHAVLQIKLLFVCIANMFFIMSLVSASSIGVYLNWCCRDADFFRVMLHGGAWTPVVMASIGYFVGTILVALTIILEIAKYTDTWVFVIVCIVAVLAIALPGHFGGRANSFGRFAGAREEPFGKRDLKWVIDHYERLAEIDATYNKGRNKTGRSE